MRWAFSGSGSGLQLTIGMVCQWAPFLAPRCSGGVAVWCPPVVSVPYGDSGVCLGFSYLEHSSHLPEPALRRIGAALVGLISGCSPSPTQSPARGSSSRDQVVAQPRRPLWGRGTLSTRPLLGCPMWARSLGLQRHIRSPSSSCAAAHRGLLARVSGHSPRDRTRRALFFFFISTHGVA